MGGESEAEASDPEADLPAPNAVETSYNAPANSSLAAYLDSARSAAELGELESWMSTFNTPESPNQSVIGDFFAQLDALNEQDLGQQALAAEAQAAAAAQAYSNNNVSLGYTAPSTAMNAGPTTSPGSMIGAPGLSRSS